MRGHLGNHRTHPRHHLPKAEGGRGVAQAIFARVRNLMAQLGAANQRLAGHTAKVQAIAAHLVGLDQCHLGLDRRANQGRDQATGAAANHDQVAVEGLWANRFPARIHLLAFDRIHDLLGDQREDAQQHKRADQTGRQNRAQ